MPAASSDSNRDKNISWNQCYVWVLNLGRDGEYNVHSVNQSKGEYVRHFIIHTNGIESVWALLKRQIFGIHHWVSDKHLNRYVSEMTWRFNRRDMKVTGRMNDLFACVEGRLTYNTLTG